MEPKNKSYKMKLLNRSVAAVLALIWIAAGFVGLLISISKSQIILVIISLLAIAYGGLWLRVAQKGRRLDWQLWRRR